MIREIINFMNDLMSDISDVTQWNVEPSKGLHIFVDIYGNGAWKNSNLLKGVDYDYYDGKNKEISLFNDCIRFQSVSDYITMNKVQKFDSKQKIHSCSPFAVAFNFNFSDADKKALGIKATVKFSKEEKERVEQDIRLKRIDVIKARLSDYKKNACNMFFSGKNPYQSQIYSFIDIINEQVLQTIQNLPEFKLLTKKDYVRIYFRNFDYEIQKHLYNKYLEKEILNGEKIFGEKEYGALGFLTSYPAKKTFMRHKTSVLEKGVNIRFTKEEALVVYDFEKMLNRNIFPNPLPIVIDKRELNESIVKIFNSEEVAVSYRDLIRTLFEKNKVKNLSDYYLLFYTKTKNGLVFNDFDFVPLFYYFYDPIITVFNVTCSGVIKNKVFESDFEILIKTVFDFEFFITKEIFNNTLVKIKDNQYSENYFGVIDPQYVCGGDTMFQIIMKYRKAFYDFTYKSKTNSIDSTMFDDIMYNSILSNINKDEVKGRFEWNNSIKKKINIWFSLYEIFNNNKNKQIMASKVIDLMSKMRNVVNAETILETPEEFAFGAGQIVSYLIDRSVASNKTYAMLEPYLQKSKTGFLQDAISHTIAIYKHEIITYKGPFQVLASNVLTYDSDIDFKPLLKFFLAGCFCNNVIYEKNK